MKGLVLSIRSCSRWILLGITAAIFAACDSQPIAPAHPSVPSRSSASVHPTTIPKSLGGVHARFFSMAQQVPGFAGVALDSSNTVATVYLSNLENESSARAAVTALFHEFLAENKYRFHGAIPALRVQKVEYDFTQLAGWREEIAGIADANITSYGISEPINRVNVRVGTPGDVARLASQLQALSIPANAVEIEVRAAATPRSSPLTWSYTNPFGGVRVTSDAVANGYGCSLGFNAYDLDGTSIFVTASHCTLATLGPDNGVFHQAAFTDRLVGQERKDPLGLFGNGVNGCPTSYWCRNSDAAKITYSQGVVGKWSRLAETSGAFWSGSYKRIVGLEKYPLVGEWVSWVGSTSGTVTGQVYNVATGVTMNVRGVNIDIQNSVEIGGSSLAGDSGGAVYYQPAPLPGNFVWLAGILFAGGPGVSFYSPLGGIFKDLDSMTVFGTTVAASGPTFINAPGNYTWTADAQGSSGYSYQWEMSNDGVNWTTTGANSPTISQLWTSISPGFHYEFYLRVTATGSGGGYGQIDRSDPIHVVVQG